MEHTLIQIMLCYGGVVIVTELNQLGRNKKNLTKTMDTIQN